ncbi:S49 family peptidase [uncultured Sulfitobacter sp.]|uniref:S49 family peptidase n=1 Tax=uncultured Sulfitobacter sp. TaxID=191468 RepID=UPI002597B04D|nr:S49 family peptidase [uncultured Sulfitobacter sp.]
MAAKQTNSGDSAVRSLQVGECLVAPGLEDQFAQNLVTYAQVPTDQQQALAESCREHLEQAYYMESRRDNEERKPFAYEDGIAVIPIHGSLLNRFAYSWGFVTGYSFIRRQINAAMVDEDVELVVFDVNSPGGEAAGCFELCEEIRELRESYPDKSVISVVDSLGASGAYALISSTERIVAIPSAKVGSIGVYRIHFDLSKMYSEAGIGWEIIQSGARKTDGNQFAPLSEEARKDWQTTVDKFRQDFAETVSAGRDVTPEQVLATEGRVYRADEALAINLIDAVRKSSEAVQWFQTEGGGENSYHNDEEDEMSEPKNKKTEVTSEQPAAGITLADVTKAATDAATAAVTAFAKEQKEDDTRTTAILALPDAKTQPALAKHLAESGASVEDATAALAAAVADAPAPKAEPKGEGAEAGGEGEEEETAAPAGDDTNHLENAMAGEEQPEVGAGGKDKTKAIGDMTDEEQSNVILGDFAAMTGHAVDDGEKKSA